MPIMKSRMAALQKRYGKEKGKEIYYKMEEEGKNKYSKKKKKVKRRKRKLA